MRGTKMSSEKNEDKYRLKEVQLRLKEGQGLYSNTVIKTAQDAVDLIRREISSYDREVVCVLNLSVKGNPITFSRLDPRYHPTNFNIAAIGTTSSAVTSAANILKSGILSNASCFILLHNHPSGDVTPSSPDFEMTRKAIFAGKLMGIPCMDHIIVGEEGYFSFQEENAVDFNPDIDKVFRAAEDPAAYNNPLQEQNDSISDHQMEGLPPDGARGSGSVTLVKISEKDYDRKHYMRIGLHGDQAYEIKAEGKNAGILVMDECNPNTGEAVPYIEWVEIYKPFRKQGYLKDVISILFETSPEIELSSSQSNLPMYMHLGATDYGIDDFTDNHMLTIKKEDYERSVQTGSINIGMPKNDTPKQNPHKNRKPVKR